MYLYLLLFRQKWMLTVQTNEVQKLLRTKCSIWPKGGPWTTFYRMGLYEKLL